LNRSSISLIFLPTLKCNAACEYCFERKTEDTMSVESFSTLLTRLLDYMEAKRLGAVKIFWQGGEILTMDPAWFDEALALIEQQSQERGIHIANELQTNLVGYSPRWNPIIKRMFLNQLGSSLDFPNLHRKLPGGAVEDFNRLWLKKYRQARSNGIAVGVITLPNRESLKIGPEEFYHYYTQEIGLTGFQVNSPFPGGPAGDHEEGFAPDLEEYADFCVALIDTWLKEGYSRGIGISPYEGILHYFRTGDMSRLLCGMRADCSRNFFSMDPYGNVSQCDCWVSSYPEFHFGNVFGDHTLQEILDGPVRERFSRRPIEIIENEDCIECGYLSICHGGCAIRAYSATGRFFAKDPYCELYKRIFSRLEQAAVEIAQGKYGSEDKKTA
jgi:uncharacterized protein